MTPKASEYSAHQQTYYRDAAGRHVSFRQRSINRKLRRELSPDGYHFALHAVDIPVMRTRRRAQR